MLKVMRTKKVQKQKRNRDDFHRFFTSKNKLKGIYLDLCI